MHLFLLFLLLLTLPYGLVADRELPLLGENARLNLKQEIELGRGLYDKLEKAGYIVDDPLLNRYLSDIGRSLLAQLDVRFRDYHFFIVRDASVNAFAAPGGFIGVNAGLIALTQSEDELAAVLAHEIAHVELKHSMQMIERSQGIGTASLLSLLAAILLSSQDPELASAMVYTSVAGSSQAMVNFTRQNEYEADRMGIELLKNSSYDARGMSRFMNLLQQKEQSGTLSSIEYLRTHPVGGNRLGEIESRLQGYRSAGTSPGQYARFREYLHYTLADAEPQVSSHEFARALALMGQGRNIDAEKLLTALSEQDPDNLWYRYALAESLVLRRQYDRASDIYASLMLLYPDDEVIAIRLIDSLQASGQIDEALQLGLKLESEHGGDARVYKRLVSLYRISGEESLQHYAEANYHWFGGDRKQAIKLYNSLLEQGLLNIVEEEKVRRRLASEKLEN